LKATWRLNYDTHKIYSVLNIVKFITKNGFLTHYQPKKNVRRAIQTIYQNIKNYFERSSYNTGQYVNSHTQQSTLGWSGYIRNWAQHHTRNAFYTFYWVLNCHPVRY
jgi:hypothetical protein